MVCPSAIFFDVDGVLLDSLPPHLQICKDKAQEYGLDIKIPTEKEFRLLIASGKNISPMVNFFTAVGFPIYFAELAVVDYERSFSYKYPSRIFNNIPEILDKLKACGWQLGLVTSNVASNILPALDEVIHKFERNCIFTYSSGTKFSKTQCLTEGAKRLRKEPATCIYVGDLKSDAEAANAAGFKFVGAAYGWGIDPNVRIYETVSSLTDLPRAVGCV